MSKRKVRLMVEALIVAGVFGITTVLLGWMLGIVCTILGAVGLFLLTTK